MKKRILLLTAAFVLAFSCIAGGGEAEDLFSQGNRAYTEGDYEGALSCYRRVMERDGLSSSLLYNMANAYYHNRDVGNAVLYYERALYLDPGNADIHANLQMARKDFGLVEGQRGEWERFFNLFNLNGWTWMTSGAFAVFSMILLWRGIAPRVRRNRSLKILIGASIGLFVVSGTGVVLQYQKMDRGVVAAGGAGLLVSPFDAASKSCDIKGGKIVRIAKTYRDYLLVEETTGKTGWIAKEHVERVIPAGDFG